MIRSRVPLTFLGCRKLDILECPYCRKTHKGLGILTLARSPQIVDGYPFGMAVYCPQTEDGIFVNSDFGIAMKIT